MTLRILNATLESLLPTLIIVPLVGFGLYRRLKRTFGRQPLATRPLVFRIVLLSLVSTLFLAWIPTTMGFFAAGGGAALGLGLAFAGLSYTRFESTSEGRFYVPSLWIGLFVTALFIGRLVARMFTVYQAVAQGAQHAPPEAIQRSPLTLGIFFLMAAYYIAYYAGLLWKRRTLVA